MSTKFLQVFLMQTLLLPLVLAADFAAAQEVDEKSEAGVLAKENPEVAEEARQTAEQDETLEQRLAARLSRVEGLRRVNVEVTAGLVTLKGLVENEADKMLAGQLVEKVDDVLAVNNRLQIDTALNRRLAPVLADGVDRLKRLVLATPLVIVACIIVWLAYWLGRFLTRWQRPFNKFRNPFLADLLRNAIQLTVLAAGVLVALNLLGATALVSAVLGAAGIVGLALGFAFRDLVENYIAGVLLSLRQPFAPNDHVVIDGHEGRVATLTSRATALITLDGNHLRLPNAMVFKGVILNYTRNPTRLLSFDVPLAQMAELAYAQKVAVQTLQTTPGIMAAPQPSALVKALTGGGAVLSCGGWVDQREANFYKVQSEAMRRVRLALNNAGALPDLVRRVRVTDASSEAEGSPLQEKTPQPGEASPAAAAVAAGADALDEAPDVSAEVTINDQLETERRSLAKQNLLRQDAPRE